MQQWATQLPASWQQRYIRWLNQRIPVKTSVVLNQKNLFIFLSRQGIYYLLLIALIWIGATNFQSNLSYALSFLLLAVLFVAILQTFANVSGLRVQFVDAEPVFAGEVARFRFTLTAAAQHEQIDMFWPAQAVSVLNLDKHKTDCLFLQHQTTTRGVFTPGRFCLQSYFPLGVVRCWTWLDLAASVWVYPKPLPADFRLCAMGEGEDGFVASEGVEEYYALKPYRAGEPLTRVAWKQYAAGRGLFVQDYTALRGGDVWLDYSIMQDTDVEMRLSKLCYCALQLHQIERPFGLRLPAQSIDAGTGDAHLRDVLRALALFNP